MNALESAIDELVNENVHLEWPQAITERDALNYVEPVLLHDWIIQAESTQSSRDVLAELACTLTEAEAHDVLASLTSQLGVGAGVILSTALRFHVAGDIARKADQLARDYEPSDDESNRSFAASVDDPIIADHSHIARMYR